MKDLKQKEYGICIGVWMRVQANTPDEAELKARDTIGYMMDKSLDYMAKEEFPSTPELS